MRDFQSRAAVVRGPAGGIGPAMTRGRFDGPGA
mgnify:CR=1 FL=1|jgi:hypothetical protein